MQQAQSSDRHLWQKVIAFFAKVSFFFTAVGIVLILLYVDQISEVYKASLGASTFICFAIGVVLNAIGNTSIPSLKPDQD